ncbi:phosphate ABC transporter permease PstA [Thiohalobacter sp. IOR34]|uniref:phosphate ABC transporter permease PstA n=1 Tax=Thiohalobacter sp. IOR34 TaxID=3057176 RepID=UPI0025B1821A|nr:phosphate ABC transporter permease PstA [Thiohalobacter sp. IOR34]WJW76852.1 phosphate ABC transporter permease PstA [Thiohalobacter sp. IOR34]
MGKWFASGSPWIWLNAAAVAASLIMVVGLLGLIMLRGMGHFWPADLHELQYREADGSLVRLIGEFSEREEVTRAHLEAAGVQLAGDSELVERILMKIGNRDFTGLDFRWVLVPRIESRRTPPTLMAVERREWGNFYGYLKEVREAGKLVAEGEAAWEALNERLQVVRALHEQIRRIEKDDIGVINHGLERLRLRARRYQLDGEDTPRHRQQIAAERARLEQRYQVLQDRLNELYRQIGRDSFRAEIMTGELVEVPLAKVVRVYRPNAMGPLDKIGHYIAKLWEFVSDEPREANTEGGIFPAIFGTVLMVMLMSVFVTPLGVIAAVYLREYAKQGPLTRLVRIAVNNLAGVPSIVYGVFGLGFFVYFLGGNIDQLFFPEALPAPTFGTPGLFWASLTLALLTLPVVIVATEEGLARIPRSIREGSLALGATKAETLWRTVLPMASPAMMTGLILAVARAAGEVAPLMLVGVVKLAPSLPLDGNYPFLHLERKFMHLGFHIYDVGFQSPNVEAARPLVFATALLLVLVILVLNLAAIAIRNRLREQYKAFDQG